MLYVGEQRMCAIRTSTDRTAEFQSFVSAARRHAKSVASRREATPDAEQRDRQAAYRDVADVLSGYMTELPATQVFRVATQATRRACDEALRLHNDQQYLHFCMVEQMLRVRSEAFFQSAQQKIDSNETRAIALTRVERDVRRVDTLYQTVNKMIEQHGHTIDIVERNVEKIQLRLDASEAELYDAAPRTFRTRRARCIDTIPCLPRTLTGRLRAGLALLIAVNLVLFYHGVL